MITLLGFSLAGLAVAAWLAASPRRAPARWSFTARRGWPALAFILGGVAAAGSARVLAGELGAWPGAILAGGAITAAASLSIIVLPLAPRALWRGFGALAALAVIAGGLHG